MGRLPKQRCSPWGTESLSTRSPREGRYVPMSIYCVKQVIESMLLSLTQLILSFDTDVRQSGPDVFSIIISSQAIMISRDLRRRCPHATERHAQRQPIHHQRFHRKGAVSILSDCVVSSPVGVQLLSASSIVRYVDLGRRASTATLPSNLSTGRPVG